MSSATVKYIVNGYTVSGHPQFVGAGESHYAATLEEAVYWVGQMIDPPPQGAAHAPPKASADHPSHTLAAEDPLANQEAVCAKLTTGGFIVRQMPNGAIASRMASYEMQCVSMDEVHDVLVQVFTAPEPPAPPAARSSAGAIEAPARKVQP